MLLLLSFVLCSSLVLAIDLCHLDEKINMEKSLFSNVIQTKYPLPYFGNAIDRIETILSSCNGTRPILHLTSISKEIIQTIGTQPALIIVELKAIVASRNWILLTTIASSSKIYVITHSLNDIPTLQSGFNTLRFDGIVLNYKNTESSDKMRNLCIEYQTVSNEKWHCIIDTTRNSISQGFGYPPSAAASEMIDYYLYLDLPSDGEEFIHLWDNGNFVRNNGWDPIRTRVFEQPEPRPSFLYRTFLAMISPFVYVFRSIRKVTMSIGFIIRCFLTLWNFV